jgi:hypothetical protein
MAAVLSEDVQVPAGAIDVPTSTETLVVVSSPLTLPGSNDGLGIRSWMDLTVGAATTAITIAIYEGAVIGGRLVGTKQPSAGDFTAGSDAHFEYETIDLLENVGGAQYCMSVTQTGATADGSVTAALLDTTLLSG